MHIKPNTAKRRPKGEIQKFQNSLNEEQKNAKRIILENDITVLKGKAGSSKTFLACNVALDLFYKREVEKIYITRPTVAAEDIGFLPGRLEDKMAPWLAPIYHNLFRIDSKENIEKLIEEGLIEIIPFSFMRGITIVNSIFIVDEAQNITDTQMQMTIGRLGKGSKLIICGDTGQIDLKNKKESGMGLLPKLAANIDGFEIIELKTNHRHPIVDKVLSLYSEYLN